MADTPLFVKTQDFIIWLLKHSAHFPKRLRHSFTIRLENTAFEFQRCILMANSCRGAMRADWLTKADGELVCLRALIRMFYSFELLGARQIEYAIRSIDELGRLLGAWIKGTDR